MNKEIFEALALLEKERGIPQSYMLDKITQDALRAHGGPYEFFHRNGDWKDVSWFGPSWCEGIVYRAKFQRQKPREFWLVFDEDESPFSIRKEEADARRFVEDGRFIIHVREVL